MERAGLHQNIHLHAFNSRPHRKMDGPGVHSGRLDLGAMRQSIRSNANDILDIRRNLCHTACPQARITTKTQSAEQKNQVINLIFFSVLLWWLLIANRYRRHGFSRASAIARGVAKGRRLAAARLTETHTSLR
jgi:hypothetical protein